MVFQTSRLGVLNRSALCHESTIVRFVNFKTVNQTLRGFVVVVVVLSLFFT